MGTLNFIEGDALQPVGGGPKVICHVCNDIGAWGSGFVVSLSRRWRTPEEDYRYAHKNGCLDLGNVFYLKVEAGIFVANMIAQRGTISRANPQPLDYDALTSCLDQVAEYAKADRATVHMPRIGCGRAGGTWAAVEAVVQQRLGDAGVEVFVYTLPGDRSWNVR